MIYHVLNIFFFVFHTLLIFFNCLGWAWKKTLRLNLFTLLLTAGSWFIMGIWYGWGYCFCTDWHWQVREKIGIHDQSNSYIHFLLLKITGINFPVQLVEEITLIVFFISLAVSIWLNVRDIRKKRKQKSPV